MRRIILFTTLQVALIGTVLSAGFELSADGMRDAEDTLHSLDSNISLKNPKALTEAEDLLQFFRQVEGHYAARGDAARGVELARRSQQQAEAVAEAVRSGDFDTAQDALTRLTRSCKSCHEVYKKVASVLDFDRWMRSIDTLSVAVQRRIAARESVPATADARELERLYALMERYFVDERPAADARRISRDGRHQAAAIPTLLAGGDFVGAAREARTIAQACNDCHDAHKPFR